MRAYRVRDIGRRELRVVLFRHPRPLVSKLGHYDAHWHALHCQGAGIGMSQYMEGCCRHDLRCRRRHFERSLLVRRPHAAPLLSLNIRSLAASPVVSCENYSAPSLFMATSRGGPDLLSRKESVPDCGSKSPAGHPMPIPPNRQSTSQFQQPGYVRAPPFTPRRLA